MMPTIQISQSKIDSIVRPILGQYYGSEDSYQDVHVKILELSPQSEEEIKAIALEENVLKSERLKKRSTRNSDHKRHESLCVKKERLRLKAELKRKRKFKNTR